MMDRKNLLFLSRWFPYPPDNGSRIRIINLLQQLTLENDITLVSFWEGDQPGENDIACLKEYCQEIFLVKYPSISPGFSKTLKGWISPQPRFMVEKHSQEMMEVVGRVASKTMFDLLIASQVDMMPYALSVNGTPRILEELEVSSVVHGKRINNPTQLVRYTLTKKKLSSYLQHALPEFSTVTTVSRVEKEEIQKIVPNYRHFSILPNGVDLTRYQRTFIAPDRNLLLYAGALSFSANMDAVRYFAADILPLIRDRVPEIRLLVTGRNQGLDLSGIVDQPGVEMTGYIQDIQPVFASAWASVVPLRTGGGTRIKILESLANGTPVISTRKGAEGLELRDGIEILIGDTPEEFAEQVVRLWNSPELRDQLSRQGKIAVQRSYSWDQIGENLRGLVRQFTKSN